MSEDPILSAIPLSHPGKRSSLLALGFRPFFLAAAALALLAMAIWLARLWGLLPGDTYLGGTAWHAHEMLFGYVGAVVAGFLLTAARNWTGIDTLTGGRLGALVMLWLAARLGPLLPLPPTLIAILDLAFFPALALALIPPLWQGKNKTNRVFLALLAAMTLANLLVHAQALGLLANSAGVVIGAMLVAAVARNLFEGTGVVRIATRTIDDLGTIALALFLTMALMSLRLWELFDLALPMLAILMVQVAMMAAFAMFVTFRLMGRDYDAAVMAGGHCGFGLGATPNAVANMNSLVESA